jgi:hypothetical protein
MTKVKCVSRGGYDHIAEGEICTLIEIQPKQFDNSVPGGFTWPEYWVVQTADGRRVHGHAYRFEAIEEAS